MDDRGFLSRQYFGRIVKESRDQEMIVEYDAEGARRSKEFTSVFKAKAFYVKMSQENRNPSIRKKS